MNFELQLLKQRRQEVFKVLKKKNRNFNIYLPPDEDHAVQLKAPGKLLNEPCCEIRIKFGTLTSQDILDFPS